MTTSPYDNIICGGGSAGCMVASRLTEDEDITVLLLEAGISDLDWPATETPALCRTLQRSKVDWSYKLEPQKFAYKGYPEAIWGAGKVLGGGSSVNHMAFTRGAAEDYDQWAARGCNGWSWKEVLPYFLKSENGICPEFADLEYHKKGGPLTISRVAKPMDVTKAFFEAGKELGFEEIDAMSGDIIGLGNFDVNIDANGKRSSASRAFIHPIKDRQNLTVLCESHVTKIKGNKAIGVHFIREGENQYVAANKEVVVSSGPMGSPKILMLSGIGPRKHLDEVGIECVADLPVGKNLQMRVDCKPGTGAWSMDKVPMTSTGCEATFFNRSTLEIESNGPDYQIALVVIFYLFGPDEPDVLKIEEKFHPLMAYDIPREERAQKEGYCLVPFLLHPKSVGEVRLRSGNHLDPPIIDPHYLEDHHDVEVMIEAMRMGKRFIESETMKQFGSTLTSYQMPGCKHEEWSGENLEEYIRHFACNGAHPVGTCKMGDTNDLTTVVDPQLRVRGIEGLRVIDSSIMPSVTSGNTNAPSIMIGEKGADMIRKGSQ